MLNKVTLIGRLGADPEIRYMPNGDQVAILNLATSRRWKDRNTSERKEETEWHRVTLFRSLAKLSGEYLKKGSLVYVEGRIKTTKYQKDGQEHFSTGIIGENLLMMDSKRDSTEARTEGNLGSRAQSSSSPSVDDFDDDIPF